MGAAGTTEETATTEATTEEAKTEEQPQVPETYELAAPEGFEIDPAIAEEATPIFKDLKLSNEQANLLTPLAAKVVTKAFERQQTEFAATKADWAKASKDDPEIGGNNWGQTETFVAKALDQFGAPKDSPFRKLLDESGLGNHPEMIRMFRKVGEQISEEGTFVRPDSGAPVKKSREESWYGPNGQPLNSMAKTG